MLSAILRNIRNLVLIILLGAAPAFANTSSSPKVLIFYSSIGMGHLSAARAIEQSIRARDPGAAVVLKDIRDFEGKISRELGEKQFWFVVKNFPNLFDKLFRKAMARGNTVTSLSEIKSSYDENAVLKFVIGENPTSIIATHYGSAQVLGNLRERGFLQDKPIAWLHTDYFKGYFPRISQRIERTFVGMGVLRDQWLEEGIPAEKVETTGMPVNLSLFEPIDRHAFLTSKGLNPQIPTIVLASGGEGVGDFPLIVRQITQEVKGPIQIVAVCAKNAKHVANLTKLKPSLRADVRLDIFGMVPNAELLNYVKSADLYITKSGGLSPTEGFAINKPIVLLDVYGGHERDNANLFEKEGLAVVNRDQSTIGKDVRRVLDSPDLQEKMLRAQLAFRNSFNLKAISDFPFDSRRHLGIDAYQLGLEMGPTIPNAQTVLDRLEGDAPADIEILLSYGKSYDGRYNGPDSNPFGHLAVRVGDRVYTANGRAKSGVEQVLIHETSLQEYLYGVDRPYQNVEMTDAFGSSYGRDNIGLRVQGIPAKALDSMRAEVASIQNEWRDGKTKWSAREHNCADFVLRILAAGGVTTEESKNWRHPSHITMPLDVLETFRKSFERNANIRTELVHYEQVAGSKNAYRSTRFPLSIHQLPRSLANYFFRKVDPVEIMAGKRILFETGSAEAQYENRNGRSAQEELKTREETLEELGRMRIQVTEQEVELDRANARLLESGATTERLQAHIEQEISDFTPQDRKALLSGTLDLIHDPAMRERAIGIMKKVNQWTKAQADYQMRLDSMTQIEMNLLIKSTLFTLKGLHEQMKKTADKKTLAALASLLNKAETAFGKYMSNVDQIGKPKDGPLRTEPYRTFFEQAKRYFDMAGASPAAQSAPVQTFWVRLKTSAHRIYQRAQFVVKLSPALLRMVIRIWSDPNATPNKAPFLDGVQGLFKAMADIAKIKVDVVGDEHLPHDMRPDGKTVYVVAPTHRDPILDAIAMSNLGLKNYLLVMAPSQFISVRSLKDRVARIDSIIPVGEGSDTPINKILEQLKKGTSNTVLIYPEGSVSAGLFETRPIREKFNWGLISRLRKEGYDVKLIPVTYQNTGKFLHRNSISHFIHSVTSEERTTTTTLNVHIGKPIGSDLLDLLNRAGPQTSIGQFIRAAWLSKLPTDADYLSGVIRLNAAEREMIRDFGSGLHGKANANGGRCELLFKN